MTKENTAIVQGMNLPISTKHSIEICNFIRYKTINQARKQLNLTLKMKLAIPLTRFHKDRGHRKGRMGPGFYPQKATKEILNLLNTLQANAQNKGLNTDALLLKEAIVNKPSTPLTGGRRRTSTKRTHIKLTAQEKKEKKK